jgi:hypothetical protein
MADCWSDSADREWPLFAHNGHRSSSDNGGFTDDLPRSRELVCV